MSGLKYTTKAGEKEDPTLGLVLNDIDDTTTTNVTYLGYEGATGSWMIKKINETSNASFTYATVINNPTKTSYSSAWTDRVTLTYGASSSAF